MKIAPALLDFLKRKKTEKTDSDTFAEVQAVLTFVSEGAFYIEELERHIDEEMLDYWNNRERVLKILTGWMLESTKD